jgi:hypothetical protein
LIANRRRGPPQDGNASCSECQANCRAADDIPGVATVYKKRTKRDRHHDATGPVVARSAEDFCEREKVQADDHAKGLWDWPNRSLSYTPLTSLDAPKIVFLLRMMISSLMHCHIEFFHGREL